MAPAILDFQPPELLENNVLLVHAAPVCGNLLRHPQETIVPASIYQVPNILILNHYDMLPYVCST